MCRLKLQPVKFSDLMSSLLSSFSFSSSQAGVEAGVSNPQFKNIKQIFRIMAIMMIPLTAKFPAVRLTKFVVINFNLLTKSKQKHLLGCPMIQVSF